jgi:hypothetical protein
MTNRVTHSSGIVLQLFIVASNSALDYLKLMKIAITPRDGEVDT